MKNDKALVLDEYLCMDVAWDRVWQLPTDVDSDRDWDLGVELVWDSDLDWQGFELDVDCIC